MDVVAQFAGSAVAVALLVGLVAWARIGKPAAVLDEAGARALFADEFPGRSVQAVWVAEDGRSALAHTGSQALIIWRVGDGLVVRAVTLDQLGELTPRNGFVALRMDDPGSGVLRFPVVGSTWPPSSWRAGG